MYWFEGKERPAGTYDDWEDARDAWVAKAAEVAAGRMLHPDRQKATFREFIKAFRLGRKYRNQGTARDQLGAINNHLLPRFGDMPMMELEKATQEIDRWLQDLQDPVDADGRVYSDYSRKTLRGQLSGICTVAVAWGYMARNPVRGTQAIENPMSKAQALERWEFDALHEAMPGIAAKLFIWVATMSGLRFGELTEIRISDIHSCDEDVEEDEQDPEEMIYFAIARTVMDNKDTGKGRFIVKPGTKTNEFRSVDLDPVTTQLILDHIDKHELVGDDLLFSMEMFRADLELIDAEVKHREIPTDLGRTEPNDLGRTYRHGTMTGYGMGKCRCEWCLYSVAEYRRRRRANGLDLKPRIKGRERRTANISGHVPRDYFRNFFMVPAIETAKIRHVRFHDLRHTHATWLAKDGISLFDLMQRMGHKTMATTQKYITLNSRPHRRGGQRMAAIMAKPVKRGLRRRAA